MAEFKRLLKHSVKLRRCILRADVVACREMACVLFVVQTCCHISTQYTTTYKDVILLNVSTEV